MPSLRCFRIGIGLAFARFATLDQHGSLLGKSMLFWLCTARFSMFTWRRLLRKLSNIWKSKCENWIAETWFSFVYLKILQTLVTPLGRRVARNFGRGASNNQVSTFEYIMPLDFKTSSTKCPFFWRLFFWIILFRFKPAKRKSVFLELTKFQKFILSKFPSYYFNWKPPFSRKTVLRKCLWRSWCYKCMIYSMLFSASIAVDQEAIVAVMVIAVFIFTCFWCSPTHVPSGHLDTRSGSTKLVRM